jgi:TonB-linked SusC/RagA family outer membrane protein
MKRGFLLMLVCLMAISGATFAQTRKLVGLVTAAEDGEPVVGASVLVQGTTLGTVTNLEGRFEINNVPSSAKKLIVSYIGMKSQTVDIKSDRIDVVLASDNEVLDEVVVTAQGLSRKEKSLGYSTQKVAGDKLTVARQTDLGNSMAGKIAGARFFGKSGATFDSGSIVLRGSSDFTSPAGSEPIYVVDGSITNKDAVNMDDVESINVLKGAAATALYGSQGGNGAVIITTKRGAAQEGKGRIELSHTIGFDTYYNHFDMQSEYGGGSLGMYGEVYADTFAEKYGSDVDTMSPQFLYGTYKGWQNADGSYYLDFNSDESWGARFDKNVMMANGNYYDSTSSQYQQASPYVRQLNLGDLFRTAWSNTTNVAFSKSGKDSNTRVSFTNVERDGLQRNSKAIRRFLGVKTNFKPADWVNVSLDYKFTYRRNHNGAQEGYGTSGNVLYSYLQWGHTEVNLNDFKDYQRPDGSWRAWNITSTTNLTAKYHDNPYAVLDNLNQDATSRWNVFTGDVEFLLPWNIKAGVRVMGNIKNYNAEYRYGEGSIDFSTYYGQTQYHTSDLTVQGRLTWGDRFLNDRLSVDAAAFIEQEQYDYGTLTGETTDGLIINGYYNLAASNGYVSATNTDTHYKTRSIFGTATVGFDDTYFLDGSIRNDWDSRLPVANNSYLYGGLSASVMLNRFVKAPWLNYWKLRGSFAQVGSTLSAYSTIMQYNYTDSSNTNYKYNSLTSLYPSATQYNSNIKPTISTSYEIGTEARAFNNRLWADINFYTRDTKNQILNMTVAPQSGYSSRQLNSGLVRNRGIEITLGGTPVKTKNFQWDIEGNIAKNSNKLVSLNEDIKEYSLSGYKFYYYWYYKAVEGKPLGVITTMARWARNEDGKLILKPSTSAAWGGGYQPTYELNEEKEVGNFQPDWTGGFNTNLRYKNLSLAANFDFMIGGTMVSWTNMWSTGSGTNASTSRLNDNGVNEREPISKGGGVKVDGVDTDGNPVSCYMNAYYYYHYKAYYDLDEWVYSRTYLKMRELSLTYQFPKTLLAKSKTGISEASVSLVASNPWLIYSACPNVDPSETGSNWREGGQAASTRSFGLTVKLAF